MCSLEPRGSPTLTHHGRIPFSISESCVPVLASRGRSMQQFGVDVSDDSTWPALLQEQVGSQYAVLNLGVAGHGTAEHLYMIGAVASRLEPDVVILDIGLNDMHCMHSPEISPLVNRCHSDLLYLSTGQCFVSRIPRLAMIHASSRSTFASGVDEGVQSRASIDLSKNEGFIRRGC